MKTILFLLFTAVAVHAQNLTATITEETKMELTKGKGSVLLKAGTAVDIVSRDGDSIIVVYRKIQGRVALAKTDFKGDAPEAAAEPAPEQPKANSPAPANPPPQAKPADPKPAAPAGGPDAPTTNYGKMVKKARDNAAKNKETLVDPANEVSGSTKK